MKLPGWHWLVGPGLLAPLVASGCGGNVSQGGDTSCLDGGSCPTGSVCNAAGQCVPVGSGGSGVGGSVVTGGVGGFGGGGFGGGGFGGGGTGGSGGFGGDPQSRLGRACATDAECGDGLFCMSADSGLIVGGGPAKGLCTTNCAPGGVDCTVYDPNGFCHESGFCVEGCSFGPVQLQQFDPSKCHGRQEMACSPLLDASGQISAVCMPTCNSHFECGGGLFCHPSDGLCRSNPPTGKLVGEACQTPDAGTGECQGTCIPMSGASGIPTANVCSAACTIGAIPSCGWDGPSTGVPAPAYCLFVPSAVADSGGPGVGDLGYCGELCDCNDDCAPNLVCESFGDPQIESFFQKKGYCIPADGATGMPCN